jgi:hypothetical protein
MSPSTHLQYMVNVMITDELTKSAEKILSEFDDMAKELTPYIERMLNQINSKSEAFDNKKNHLNKEIDRGARTTRHRLHL